MFSGRWDESLPKDKDGNFFIDYGPELFSPLLKYLRCLGSMVAPEVNPKPPLTPSFSSSLDESYFRQMVDAYGLTNVLYNYEIYEYGRNTARWSSERSVVSNDASILDFDMQSYPDGKQCRNYSLDRHLRANDGIFVLDGSIECRFPFFRCEQITADE